MRSIRQPLDDLLKEDSDWTWSARCQQAFESIKGILNSEMWIQSWTHSCWLTGRHPRPLFHNNIVQLNSSSDVSPKQHSIFYSGASNQWGVILKWNTNSTADMEQSSTTSMGETLSIFVTANPMTGWQHQSLNELGVFSTT
jgi:hypothetical protein